MDDQAFRIAGALPAGFDFPESGSGLLLRGRPSAQELAGIGGNRAHVIARSPPYVDATPALAELTALSLRFEREHTRLRPGSRSFATTRRI